MSVLVQEPLTSARECPHVRTEFLGSAGREAFYRRAASGSVVILASGQRWVFHAEAPG